MTQWAKTRLSRVLSNGEYGAADTACIGALALEKTARSLLFGLEGHDPLVVVVAGTVLALVALAAGYLPARRASRIHPMQALRYE